MCYRLLKGLHPKMSLLFPSLSSPAYSLKRAGTVPVSVCVWRRECFSQRGKGELQHNDF